MRLVVAFILLALIVTALACPCLQEHGSDLENLNRCAHDLLNNRQFDAAKACFRRATELAKTHPVPWTGLASVYRATGDLLEATRLFKHATTLGDYYFAEASLGSLYADSGQKSLAIEHYRNALRMNENFMAVYNNLGILLQDSDPEEAAEVFRKATTVDPTFPEIYVNWASLRKDDPAQRRSILLKGVKHCPDHAMLRESLGLFYLESGENARALELLEEAVLLEKATATTWYNLGNVARDAGYMLRAAQAFEHSIALQPARDTYNNLGLIYLDIKKLPEAERAFRAALAFDQSFSESWTNLGVVYRELGRDEEAIAAYQEALRYRPQWAEAHNNLASLYDAMDRHEDAIGHYAQAAQARPDLQDPFFNMFHARTQICDWKDYDKSLKEIDQRIQRLLKQRGGQTPLRVLHAMSYPLSGQVLKQLSMRESERILIENEEIRQQFSSRKRRARSRNLAQDPLRVGFMSSDLGSHPVGVITQYLFGALNRQRFRIFCYSLDYDDASSELYNIRSGCDTFRSLYGNSLVERAETLFDDKLDILVDMNGFTEGHAASTLSLQVAPVQVQYLGYAQSSGSSWIQYLITDAIASPPGTAELYTEKLVYLPHSYMIAPHRRTNPEVFRKEKPSLSELQLPSHAFVFASFGKLYKITPDVFAAWMRILLRTKDHVVLWLMKMPSTAEAFLRREARAAGVADHRLVFTDILDKSQHMWAKQMAHCVLDTHEYGAHSTAADTLWSGLPLITFPSPKMASRVAASILHAHNVSFLTTHSWAAYEDLAVRMAEDADFYASVRQQVENNRGVSPLFDAERYVRGLEKALEAIWKDALQPVATRWIYPAA